MTGRIEKLQQEYAISVRWRAFPLHPETPEEGRTLAELFHTTPEKIAAILANLETTARDLGLPFGPRTRTYNSRLAQELGMWATERGRGEDFHKEAFKAYFADGLNIAKTSVLLGIIRNLELPEDEAAEVLDRRVFKEEVDKDWLDSRLKGVTAVPTFIIGHDTVVGAQPYEILEQFVRLHGVEKRSRHDYLSERRAKE